VLQLCAQKTSAVVSMQTRDQLRGVYDDHEVKKEVWLACGDLADVSNHVFIRFDSKRHGASGGSC
jgi:hypothetical protein